MNINLTQDEWCVSDGAIDLTQFTAVGGGTYALETSPETALDGNVYEPQNGDGIIGIVYTPAADGCGAVSTEYIEIFDEVQAAWDNPTPLCQADLPYQLQ